MIACTHISLAQYSGVLLSARSTQLTWEDFSTFQHRTATLTFPPLSSRFTPSLSSGAVPPAAVLWASASTMNDKLELPSKLLSLPNELWHHIMSSTQIAENPIRGFAALANKERSLSLRNASLAHRILQPFAQEELLRILHIDSHDSLWMLLETLEGSDRLAGYAKRMVAIRLIRNDNKCYFNVILDDGILKRLSKLCTNVRELDVYAVNRFNLSEVTCFTKLRRLCVDETGLEGMQRLRSLPYLEVIDFGGIDWDESTIDLGQLRSFLSPAQLPALRHLYLSIHMDLPPVVENPTLYDTLLPQLTHLEFTYPTLALVLPQLQLGTALTFLRIDCTGLGEEDLPLAFMNTLKALNLEEFHFRAWAGNEDDEGWQFEIAAVWKLVEVLGDITTFKKLSVVMLDVDWQNRKNSKRAEEWIKFKKDVRKMCSKKKIEIVFFDVKQSRDSERDELAWVD